jgi:hypothetical protein
LKTNFRKLVGSFVVDLCHVFDCGFGEFVLEFMGILTIFAKNFLRWKKFTNFTIQFLEKKNF